MGQLTAIASGSFYPAKLSLVKPFPKKVQYDHFYKNINGFQAVFLNKRIKLDLTVYFRLLLIKMKTECLRRNALFSANEILDMAIKLEKNGEVVYRDAIANISNPELITLLEWMADEEVKHADWFA